MGNSAHFNTASRQPDRDRSAVDADLARLRALLLGKDYERLLALQQDYRQLAALKEELGDPSKQAGRVAGILSEAVLLREHADRGVSKALQPAIADSIKASVRKDPQPLIEAIFPVIGPAIRRSVSEAITGMLQVFEQLLEHNLSLRALKWRFEAWRTGRSYTEVVLLRTLVYWVEQVFLIHRESGLLLEHVASRQAGIRDPSLVSGMLSAIKDFMSDSFTLPQTATVRSLQVGDCNVMLEEGRLAVLATVVRGNPPSELSRTIRGTLETIHLLFGAELERFDGDTAPFTETRDYLEDCLKSQAKGDNGKRPWRALMLLTLLLVPAAGYWGYQAYQHHGEQRERHQVWSAALQQLRDEPGLIVVSAEQDDANARVRGLRDPMARDPVAVIGLQARERLQWEWQWQPYLSMEHDFLLARARRVLNPPDSVNVSLAGSVIQLTGQAPQRWIDGARAAVSAIAGITGYRDDGLVATEAILARYRRAIESIQVTFASGESTLDESEIRHLQALIPTLELVQDLADELGLTATVHVQGHTDRTGSQAENARLSKLRAEAVVAVFVDQGLEPASFTITAAGSTLPARRGSTPEDQALNRRITLDLILSEKDAEPHDKTEPRK